MTEKMIEIPFIYQIEGIKKRGKNISNYNMIDSQTILIKDISEEDLEEKKVFSIKNKEKNSSTEDIMDYYYINNNFYSFKNSEINLFIRNNNHHYTRTFNKEMKVFTYEDINNFFSILKNKMLEMEQYDICNFLKFNMEHLLKFKMISENINISDEMLTDYNDTFKSIVSTNRDFLIKTIEKKLVFYCVGDRILTPISTPLLGLNIGANAVQNVKEENKKHYCSLLFNVHDYEKYDFILPINHLFLAEFFCNNILKKHKEKEDIIFTKDTIYRNDKYSIEFHNPFLFLKENNYIDFNKKIENYIIHSYKKLKDFLMDFDNETLYKFIDFRNFLKQYEEENNPNNVELLIENFIIFSQSLINEKSLPLIWKRSILPDEIAKEFFEASLTERMIIEKEKYIKQWGKNGMSGNFKKDIEKSLSH